MAEWLKAADCKSVGSPYVGSNPIFSIISILWVFLLYELVLFVFVLGLVPFLLPYLILFRREGRLINGIPIFLLIG